MGKCWGWKEVASLLYVYLGGKGSVVFFNITQARLALEITKWFVIEGQDLDIIREIPPCLPLSSLWHIVIRFFPTCYSLAIT